MTRGGGPMPPALAGLDLTDPAQVSDQLLSFLGANGVPAPIPEPATWALMLAGMALPLGRMSRRR